MLSLSPIETVDASGRDTNLPAGEYAMNSHDQNPFQPPLGTADDTVDGVEDGQRNSCGTDVVQTIEGIFWGSWLVAIFIVAPIIGAVASFWYD